MKNSFTLTLLTLFAAFSLNVTAQTSDYYKDADGMKAAELKTALSNIINPHTDVTYNGLWTLYEMTDKRDDGLLWDMYSNTTNYVIGGTAQGANYSKEGDSYNREHTVPQSWFGEQSPMKADAFHVIPTDGYVNNRRGNLPYGEVSTPTYSSNNAFSKIGACTTSGYTGTVFEPNDEYKGDFARIYFYMVTCYENQSTSWGGDIFTDTTYPGLTTWQLNMYLRWAQQDPVSKKEIDRNNAIYEAQGNRNPFVDYPGLEQYIWGDYTNIEFSYNDYVQPTQYGNWEGDDPEEGGETGNETPADSGTFALVKDVSTLATGDKIIIVCPSDNVALSTTQNSNNRGQEAVIIANGEISSPSADVQVITLESAGDGWYLNTGDGYLYAASSSKNLLKTEAQPDDNAKASITITPPFATIKFMGDNTRNTIMHNSSSPIFSCYQSGQHELQIYRKKIANDISSPHADDTFSSNIFYNLAGQRVEQNYKGIVIHNGRKYINR